jgi:amino acid transporter
MFPHRSGGQVVYLEQAYPRPALLFPTAYAFFTVVFSFSSSNAVGKWALNCTYEANPIVLARYIYRAAEYDAGEWANKGLAIGANTFLSLLCLLSTRWSIRLMNLISAVKLIILVFIAITGFVVLGGGTRVKDPHVNFRNSFDGITNNANGIVNALVNINFAYTGYSNAFNVVAEIKVRRLFHAFNTNITDEAEPFSYGEKSCTHLSAHRFNPLHPRERSLLCCCTR